MQPAMNSAVRRVFQLIVLLALAGVVVSSVSLRHHYGTSQTNYCDFGASFNCDIVNRSVYSTVFGTPDALIGILGYGLLLTLATLYRTKAETPFMLLVTSTGGLGFALYLTYIEKFVLATWCILCLSSLTLIVSDYGTVIASGGRCVAPESSRSRSWIRLRASTGEDAYAYIRRWKKEFTSKSRRETRPEQSIFGCTNLIAAYFTDADAAGMAPPRDDVPGNATRLIPCFT